MTDTLHIEPPDSQRQEEKRFPVVFLAAMIVIVLSFGFYFWSVPQRPRSSAMRQAHLPFGLEEQAYAAKIQIEHVALSRAENFFHQEVTTLSGELANTGNRSLKNVELTIVFYDELHQVVLRDSRILFSAISAPLAPGGRREFEVSFEHIPSSWNMEQPTVSISGIQLAAAIK